MGKIIPGWLSKREEKLLAYFAAKTPGLIVEIGSYQGKSTVAMARVTKNKIYAIDPHYLKSYKKFLANTKKYKNIIPIKKTSEKANINWKLPIALLHIDGNHEYEFVKQDIKLWLKHLENNGVVVFHDAFAPYPQVWQAVYEEIFLKNFGYIGINDSQIFAIKNGQTNFQKPFIVLASNIWHNEKLPYFLRDFIVKRLLKPFYLNPFLFRGILNWW
jgi:hypothetical protein